MLQTLWQFLSSFFPGAGCQGSREGSGNEVPGTPAPARGEPGPSFLGKQDGRAEATEKRPTILLVVGPAEQFPKVTAARRGPRAGAGGGPCSWKDLDCGEEGRTGRSPLGRGVPGGVSGNGEAQICGLESSPATGNAGLPARSTSV